MKIKSTGKTAWLIVIGSIGVKVTLVISSAGLRLSVAALSATASVGIIGRPATISAIGIAIAGVSALNKLRAYKIVENNDERLVLKRKK